MTVPTHCGIFALALALIILPYEYPTSKIYFGDIEFSVFGDVASFDFDAEDDVLPCRCCPVKRKFAASLT